MMRTAAALLCVIPAVSTSALPGVALSGDEVNLAPNPGVELADGLEPAFWSQRTPTDHQRALDWDAQIARSGTRSVKIHNRVAVISRWRYGHLCDLGLEPGSPCLLTAWTKVENAEGSAYAKLYFMDAAGHIVDQPQSNRVHGTGDWSQVRLPFVVPEKTAYVMIYLELNGKGTAWYDDIVLTGTAAKPSASLAVASLTCGAEDFERLTGYVRKPFRRQPVVELAPGVAQGRAELVFWNQSARYDVTVSCLDHPDAGCRLRLLVNDKEVAQWSLDETVDRGDGLRDKVVRNADIQRRSRVALEGQSQGARCRIRKVTFVPAGRFQGVLLPEEKLRTRPSLRIYEAFDERKNARAMLNNVVSRGISESVEKRGGELALLRSPDDWRKRQQETRNRLEEFFGSFGPRCPLNARIVGKLERPDYVIEKLIFESQPKYYCTANFYVPKGRRPPLPGVLFTCGHAAEGKAYHLYHDCCLGLVLKGYVVLALDPTGQGERSEYFDPETSKPLVPPCVSQHHYLGRPSWLVGCSLAGYRTWDCTRSIDYLVSRTEVDPQKIAVVGNSGGGIMALLTTAFDPRVKVCAAAHPGGSMEQTFLNGRRIPEADVLSLIPPRPCLFVVGRDSGEEAGHRSKMDNMLPFYEGLGVEPDRCRMVLVDGVHNMEKPKREPCYGWLNRWFAQETEGSQEPPLESESVETLRCSETGFVLRDLGGESGQTLNARVAGQLRPPRPIPDAGPSLDAQRVDVKAAIARRIGLTLSDQRPPPECIERGSFQGEGFSAVKLLVESEDGIVLPSLLFRPNNAKPNAPVVLSVSESGKPTDVDRPSLVLELVRHGYTVFAVDVRGSGETDPRVRDFLSPVTHYDSSQFRFDSCAVEAAHLGTTVLAMRSFDVLRSVDYLAGCQGLSTQPVVLVGEGLGGIWALTAAAFDPRPAGVVCVGTVPSYKLIVDSQYYAVRDYYWVPGALKDYDVSDLPGLIAPRSVTLVDPVDAMLQPVERQRCREICRWPAGVYQALNVPERLRFVQTTETDPQQTARQVVIALEQIGS